MEAGLGCGLAENVEVIDGSLQREALTHGCEGNDDLALFSELGDYAFNAGEDAVAHTDPGSNRKAGVRPQRQAGCQSYSNLGEFLIAHPVPLSISQEVKDAGGRDDSGSALREEAREYVSGKKWALGDDGSVRPLYAFGVEGKIVLDRAHIKMLGNTLFMI